MTKFEYHLLPIPISNTRNVLNDYGAYGWELVGFHKGWAYFKRPIEEDKQEAPKQPDHDFSVPDLFGDIKKLLSDVLSDFF